MKDNKRNIPVTISDKVISVIKRIDEKHSDIAQHTAFAEKVTRIIAFAASTAAIIAAPTGLTAVGVSLGVLATPAIIIIAPFLILLAAAAAALSALASLYSEHRQK